MSRSKSLLRSAVSIEARSRASLLEVAAARALMDAELAGVNRERVLPVLTQIAESAYVRLAMIELSKGSWDPRHVVSSGISDLRQKMHSDEGLAELQSRLGVQTRNSKRFVVFAPEGPAFTDVPPEPNTGQAGQYIDIWNVAQRASE